MKIFFFILFLMVGVAFGQEKPNIIWIFSDDHSYQTIGAYGGRLQELNPTPHIDQLASEGMRFDKCYVENSICAPSRATLLTGKMSHKHGKYNNQSKVAFDHDQQQFQKILQSNGYQTAMIGKIHLDGEMQGFDYWDVLVGQGEYIDPDFKSINGITKATGYVSDVITDKAIGWLDGQRDKSQPFMLMVHHKAPNRPWVPKRQYLHLYDDVNIPLPDNFFDDYKTKTSAAYNQTMSIAKDMKWDYDLKLEPVTRERYLRIGIGDQFAHRQEKYADLKLEGEELAKFKYQIYMQDYLSTIYSVDENVGKLMDYLKKTGLHKNTVIMYSSDQGFYMGEHGWFDKRFMYEESFRTPLIVKWPGVVEEGSVNTDLVQNIDFAETFLDIAGAPIPEDMQGKSLVPLLKDKTPDDWRKSLYYHYYEYPGPHSVLRHEGVANKQYKLIRFYGKDAKNGEEWEFYDLIKDPSEMHNAYSHKEYKKQIKDLKAELAYLRAQYEVPSDIKI